MSTMTLRRIATVGIGAVLLGALHVGAAPAATSAVQDCGAADVKFTAGFVHQQWNHAEVRFANVGAISARCRVTLAARKANGATATSSPGAVVRSMPADSAATADFHLDPPQAGTYRVRACARAVRNGVVVDANSANDCVVVVRTAS